MSAKTLAEKVWADQYEKTFYGESSTHDLPSSANWHHFLDTHIGLTGTQGDNGAYCDQACAEAECAAAPGMAWKPENYSTHPYECCKTR